MFVKLSKCPNSCFGLFCTKDVPHWVTWHILNQAKLLCPIFLYRLEVSPKVEISFSFLIEFLEIESKQKKIPY